MEMSRFEPLDDVTSSASPEPEFDVRAEFPQCAKMVDEFRAVFGEVKVLCAEENDRQLRKKNRPDESNAVSIGVLIETNAHHHRLTEQIEDRKRRGK